MRVAAQDVRLLHAHVHIEYKLVFVCIYAVAKTGKSACVVRGFNGEKWVCIDAHRRREGNIFLHIIHIRTYRPVIPICGVGACCELVVVVLYENRIYMKVYIFALRRLFAQTHTYSTSARTPFTHHKHPHPYYTHNSIDPHANITLFRVPPIFYSIPHRIHTLPNMYGAAAAAAARCAGNVPGFQVDLVTYSLTLCTFVYTQIHILHAICYTSYMVT